MGGEHINCPTKLWFIGNKIYLIVRMKVIKRILAADRKAANENSTADI